MNTLLLMDSIDCRIEELKAEIELLTDRRDAVQCFTENTPLVNDITAEIDALEDELQELEDFDRVVTLAGTDSDAVDAALDYAAGDLDRAAELIGNGVQDYASARDFGEQLIDGLYMRKEIEGIAAYIDYEAFGTDALMDVEYHEHNGRIYIFNT